MVKEGNDTIRQFEEAIERVVGTKLKEIRTDLIKVNLGQTEIRSQLIYFYRQHKKREAEFHSLRHELTKLGKKLDAVERRRGRTEQSLRAAKSQVKKLEQKLNKLERGSREK
jgi:septal ring factor EnvC (AmiA/AmiB activator)